MMNNFDFKKHIRDVHNFPKKGIVFRDIMPLLANPELFKASVERMCHSHSHVASCDILVGLESRGFLFAGPMAFHLSKPFVTARKKGKLPGDVVAETYSLEYGEDVIEIQKHLIIPGKRYVIVDDLIATGGTALATARLIENNKGIVDGFVFFIELAALDGRAALQKQFPRASCTAVVVY